MAFKQYKTIVAVLRAFGIKYREDTFIQINPIALNPLFLAELNFSKAHIDIRASEAAICENIIYPILREAYKKYAESLALWSHKSLSYDETLSGIPDYLVTSKSELGRIVLGSPVVLVVEAKKSDFDEGWGQCLAEMVAAQKINNDAAFVIYGIVTDGEVWRFGQLRENEFTENSFLLTISELEKVFGALDFLLETSQQQIKATSR